LENLGAIGRLEDLGKYMKKINTDLQNILAHRPVGRQTPGNNQTTGVATQQPARQWTGWVAIAWEPPAETHATIDPLLETVFYTRSVPRGYQWAKFTV
jgi:hypothetical protein